MFKKATREQSKLRMALAGPAGSGKTYTALLIAHHMGWRTAVLDTEHGSASKYAGLFMEFDTVQPKTFDPQALITTIAEAESQQYDVLVVDSFTHFWAGTGGALEIVDRITSQSRSHNAYTEGWRVVTPLQNKMIDAIMGCGIHIIATMRTKMEYVLEKDEKGRSSPQKKGLGPVQRKDIEYEFDVIAELDQNHRMLVSKTRCPALDNLVSEQPGKDIADILRVWLMEGEPPKPDETKEVNEAKKRLAKEHGADACQAALTANELSSPTTMEEVAALEALLTESKET